MTAVSESVSLTDTFDGIGCIIETDALSASTTSMRSIAPSVAVEVAAYHYTA